MWATTESQRGWTMSGIIPSSISQSWKNAGGMQELISSHWVAILRTFSPTFALPATMSSSSSSEEESCQLTSIISCLGKYLRKVWMDKCLTLAKLPTIFLTRENISDDKIFRNCWQNIPNMGMKKGSSKSTMDWNQTGLLALQASLLSTQSKLAGPSFLRIGSITFKASLTDLRLANMWGKYWMNPLLIQLEGQSQLPS